VVVRFPRPHRRGWIETDGQPKLIFELLGFPRPHRRGRIETANFVPSDQPAVVSPGLTAGGGLKLTVLLRAALAERVSPGLTAGGGLKRKGGAKTSRGKGFPPASPPGAD